jgi:MarR family 2-MHQ and catechol resistance regulon transcriptional repressor
MTAAARPRRPPAPPFDVPSPRGAGTAAGLAADAAAFYEALSELLRLAQFRDRERICCYDISVTECYSLELLARGGPLMLNQLAANLHLDKSTASRVAAGLEEKGYLRREEDPLDRRALRLRLTPRGESLHRRIRGDIEARHAAHLAQLDPATRRAATDLLRRLAAELGRCGEPGPSCCASATA